MRVTEYLIANRDFDADELERLLQQHPDPIVRALAARLCDSEAELLGFHQVAEGRGEEGPEALDQWIEEQEHLQGELDALQEANVALGAERDELQIEVVELRRELSDAKEHINTLNQLILALKNAGADLV